MGPYFPDAPVACMGNDRVMAGPYGITWVLATANPIPPVSLDSLSILMTCHSVDDKRLRRILNAEKQTRGIKTKYLFEKCV